MGGWKRLSNIVQPIMLGSFVDHCFSTSTSLEDRLDRYINECREFIFTLVYFFHVGKTMMNHPPVITIYTVYIYIYICYIYIYIGDM